MSVIADGSSNLLACGVVFFIDHSLDIFKKKGGIKGRHSTAYILKNFECERQIQFTADSSLKKYRKQY